MKRFVSYIYAIQKQQKVRNAGFARMELRSGRNRVEIHLRDGQYAGKKGNVYLYVRKDGGIRGILLGEISFRDNQADFEYVQKEEQIRQTPYKIDDMNGIMLRIGNETVYLSQWDEEPLDTTQFIEWTQENQPQEGEDQINGQSYEKEKQPVSHAKQIHTSNNQRATVEYENPMTQNQRQGASTPKFPVEEVRSSQQVQAQTEKRFPKQGRQPEQRQTGNQFQQEGRQSAQSQTGDQFQQEGRQSAQSQTGDQFQQEGRQPAQRQTGDQFQQEDRQPEQRQAGNQSQQRVGEPGQSQAENMPQQEGSQPIRNQAEAQPQQENQKKASSHQESTEHSQPSLATADLSTAVQFKQEEGWEEKWRKMLRSYPVLDRLEGQPDARCVRIELKDIRSLPKKYWSVMNNSFLLHGFFNYHYLIFGRIGEKWIIGIPGIFQSQEQIVASIFGFPEFVTQGRVPDGSGVFGYWYRTLPV